MNMLPIQIIVRWGWLVGLVVLTGCALNETPAPDATPLPRLLITPAIALMNREGTCDEDYRLVELWLGTTDTARLKLNEIIDEALAEADAVGMRDELVRLGLVRNSLIEVAVPDCAEDAHLLILTSVDLALVGLQHVQEGDALFDDYRRQIDAYLERYERLHDNVAARIADI